MFLGDYEHSLDDKGRVVLPAALRRGIAEDALKDRFYLVPSDEDECLELHPRESWERFVAELERRHQLGVRSWRDFLRDLYSTSTELQLDKQYRFMVPEASKNAVGIERDVYFVGLGDFIEIWSKANWQKRREQRRGQRKTPVAAPNSVDA